MKTKIINGIEYELEQHDNGKKLSEIKIPKGWRLLKPIEAMMLWEEGYLTNNWIFVEQTNKKLKKEGYVARFDAYSGGAGLVGDWGRGGRVSGLGVLFCREVEE